MPDSEPTAARARRIVASGLSVEQAAEAVGWPPSRVRAALKRGQARMGRPPVDTAELRVRIDGDLHRALRGADVDVRSVVEWALARALRRVLR